MDEAVKERVARAQAAAAQRKAAESELSDALASPRATAFMVAETEREFDRIVDGGNLYPTSDEMMRSVGNVINRTNEEFPGSIKSVRTVTEMTYNSLAAKTRDLRGPFKPAATAQEHMMKQTQFAAAAMDDRPLTDEGAIHIANEILKDTLRAFPNSPDVTVRSGSEVYDELFKEHRAIQAKRAEYDREWEESEREYAKESEHRER